MAIEESNSKTIEQLPRAVRFVVGCAMAATAVILTYTIPPLRAFPLLLAFPTVIFVAWFLDMAGAAGCALTGAILVDWLLTHGTGGFATGDATQLVWMAIFIAVSLLLGWAMRWLSEQRAQLSNSALQLRLSLAESERRVAEERARATEVLRDRDEVLQLALKANGMGLWVWNLKEGTINRSDEVFRMVGCEPDSFGPDPDEWLQFVEPEDRDSFHEAFLHARTTGADYRHQYRVRWPDGSLHWLESQGRCQRGSDGQMIRIAGVTADVTNRKQAEEAMLRAEKLAVAGRLAASVAHEINNPLEAVANILYLITLTDNTESAHTHATHALEELMRISLITQSTLKFHHQTGTPKITMLSEVLDGVLALFRGKLHNMEIEVKVETGLEVPIACMPSETQQVFANLVSNAIEAMPRRGRLLIRLRASSDWRGPKRQGMRVTICDSGAGIDQATMRRIFEPFYTTKTDTGTGLGLWVVAQLIDRHRGNVKVYSWRRPSTSGTAFSVFLPVGEVPSNFDRAELDRSQQTQGSDPENTLPGLFSVIHKS